MPPTIGLRTRFWPYATLANLHYLLDHDLQANAREVGAVLMHHLEDLHNRSPIIGEVRGKRLMIGVEFVQPGAVAPHPTAAEGVLEAARERGLLLGRGGSYGHVVRIGPPLSLTLDEAEEGVQAFTGAVEEIAR